MRLAYCLLPMLVGMGCPFINYKVEGGNRKKAAIVSMETEITMIPYSFRVPLPHPPS